MEKAFTEIFSKQPDEIIEGDYFYYVPWYEVAFANPPPEVAEVMRNARRNIPNEFFGTWIGRAGLHSGTVTMALDGTILEGGQQHPYATELRQIANEIASESKPFLEISGVGIAPAILKINPKIPLLLTDIHADAVKIWRSCVNGKFNFELTEDEVFCLSQLNKISNVAGYNISFASFDNHDMPIKDNSLYYVTSFCGISGIVSDNKEKLINEVYRILKPGGCFVTVEDNHAPEKKKKEIQELSLRDRFIKAGFQVEIEEIYPQKETFYVLRKPIE
jgi:SAM-dependent methyltransferase